MTRRRRRRRLGGPGSVPVVLPRVVARPQSAGTVTITLDGRPVSDGPIPRVQLGEALSQIVEQVGAAFRVEIHEPDGIVHADILTPPDQRPLEPASDRPPAGDRQRFVAPPTSGLESGQTVLVPVATTAIGRRASRNVDLDQKRARDRPELSPSIGAASRHTSHLRELA